MSCEEAPESHLAYPREVTFERLLDLDHAATTPLCGAARSAMDPFLAANADSRYGNPSGTHLLARDAVRALDEAREIVAEAVGAKPSEVVFTSGGTEADNHAITGGMPPRSAPAICSAVEHHAVLDPTLLLGGSTTPVDRLGRVLTEELAASLAERRSQGIATGVISVMTANNELGTVNHLEPVAAVIRQEAPGTLFHTDAVQAAAWLPLPEYVAVADLVSVSAHKIGGPKGVGALIVREPVKLAPLLFGGSQERERRGGTNNVAGIVGFAAAFAATVSDLETNSAKVSTMRDQLADELVNSVDGVRETVGPEVAESLGLPRGRGHLLAGHCHLLVDGVGSEELLLLLEGHGVCAAAASSCASGAVGASHVLEAVGADPQDAAALRLTLGPELDSDDLRRVTAAFSDAVSRARSQA